MKKIDENKENKNKKGYFLSISIVTALLILSIFVIQIVSSRYAEFSQLRNQVFAEKVSFTLDDIRMDLKKVLSFYQGGNSSQVVFIENYSYNKSSFLSQEQTYLNYFANVTALNITFSYSLPLSMNFTNGMHYVTNESNPLNKEIRIYNSTGTNLTANLYNITIRSNQTMKNYSYPTFIGSGTYVILNYIDPVPAKSFTSEGYLDFSSLNSWVINFSNPTQTINVSFGLIDGKTNAVSIKQNSINCITNVKIIINMTDKRDLEGKYNTFVNMTSPTSSYVGYVPVR